MREYPRTSTTVANAYVQPITERYLARVDEGLRQSGIEAPLKYHAQQWRHHHRGRGTGFSGATRGERTGGRRPGGGLLGQATRS